MLDTYFHPFRQGSRHIIHSCTKSIISALIGIAIEEGYIESVNQPILSFFPERTVAHRDIDKEAMTLEHVLTMTTGLECRDSQSYDWRGLQQMRETDDWVQFVLDLPMAEPPGTQFEYCNGASFLLSAIIQETSGMNALAFAKRHLFDPLGISDVGWPSSPQGITIGWGELWMRPHDMAKIGYLYLNEGRWDGEQIVPAAWVETSTADHSPSGVERGVIVGYGYQWWVDSSARYYFASGLHGQFIFVLPKLDLVVVFTSDLVTDEETYIPPLLLEFYIIPAVQS